MIENNVVPQDGDIRIQRRIIMRENWRGDKMVSKEEIVFQQYRGGYWIEVPTVTKVIG